MTEKTDKPLALALAAWLDGCITDMVMHDKAAAELRRQHQAIVELQADAARYAQLKAAYTSAHFNPADLDLPGAVALIFCFKEKGIHISADLDKTIDSARATITKHQET